MVALFLLLHFFCQTNVWLKSQVDLWCLVSSGCRFRNTSRNLEPGGFVGLSLNFDSPQEFVKLEIPQPGGETNAEKLLPKSKVPGGTGRARVNLGFESGESPDWAKVGHQPRTESCTRSGNKPGEARRKEMSGRNASEGCKP